MNHFLDPKSSITRERIRQAKYSFNLALGVTALSFGLGFFGAVLLISGKVSERLIAAAVGFTSGVPAVKFAKENSDRLDKILAEREN